MPVVLGMGVIAIVLIFMGYRVKVQKNINTIPIINEERLKKIKKVDKVCNDFGNRLFILAGIAIAMAIATYFFGNIGKWVGLVVFVGAVLNWSSFCSEIDAKIKKKIY